MRHVFVGLAILICNCGLLCLPQSAQAQPNYINYHKEIISAEELIFQDKYLDAILAYDNIFKKYPKSFVKDCYIAAQVACLTNDSLLLKRFMRLCIEKGIPSSQLLLDKNIHTYLNNHLKTLSDIKMGVDQQRNIYMSSINIPLRYKITSMYLMDQLYHGVPSEYNGDSLFNEVITDNMNKTIQIVKQCGYPGEHLIGISNSEMDNTCYKLTDLELEEVTPIFFYHNACTFQLLKAELYNAVINGDLHPREYALIYEWSYGEMLSLGDTSTYTIYVKDSTGSFTPSIIHKNDNSKVLGLCLSAKPENEYRICKLYDISKYFQSKTINDVNMDRIAVGISTIQHDIEKERYAQKHGLKLCFGSYGNR